MFISCEAAQSTRGNGIVLINSYHITTVREVGNGVSKITFNNGEFIDVQETPASVLRLIDKSKLNNGEQCKA